MKNHATTATYPSTLKSWVIVGVLLIGATAGGFLLDHHISLTSQSMVYVLAVVVASYRLKWLQSVVCAVGAVTAFNYFFVPPRWTFEVDSQEHLIALFTMLLVALVISHLASRLRGETEVAQLNMCRASQLQELASGLSVVTTAEEIASLGQTALASAFEGPCVLVLRGPDDELALPVNLSSNDADGMRCCMREMAVLGPGTGRWPGLDAWFLPLRQQTQRQRCSQHPASASQRHSRSRTRTGTLRLAGTGIAASASDPNHASRAKRGTTSATPKHLPGSDFS
jgi:two-component system sensor histidine kinase KdpD